MADMIVNHISRRSPQFADFDARGDASPYAGLFLTFARVFPRGASDADLLALHAIRPGLPFTQHQTAHGERVLLWTTFTSEQIDIDVHHPEGRRYLDAHSRAPRGRRRPRDSRRRGGYADQEGGHQLLHDPGDARVHRGPDGAGARARPRGARRNARALSRSGADRSAGRLGLRLRAAAARAAHAVHARRDEPAAVDRHQAGELRHRARYARRHRRAGRRPRWGDTG